MATSRLRDSGLPSAGGLCRAHTPPPPLAPHGRRGLGCSHRFVGGGGGAAYICTIPPPGVPITKPHPMAGGDSGVSATVWGRRDYTTGCPHPHTVWPGPRGYNPILATELLRLSVDDPDTGSVEVVVYFDDSLIAGEDPTEVEAVTHGVLLLPTRCAFHLFSAAGWCLIWL